MTARVYRMPFGAELRDGGARFALWAPGAASVELELVGGPRRGRMPMSAGAGGWHEVEVGEVDSTTRYAFRIDGRLLLPDPASRCNPDGVHGPSRVVDPAAWRWSDGGWRGRPWHEAVIYELHVGAFTPAGSFAAAQAPAATANTGDSTTPGFASNSPSWGAWQTLFLASIGCDNTNSTNRWSDAHWIAPTYAQANASAGCTAWCSGRIYRAGSSYTPGSQQATQRQYVAHNLAIRAA